MLKRFFLYGMPFYLTAIELLMKFLLSHIEGRHEEASLVLSGPSIAVAGMTLILPVLTPKPVNTPVIPASFNIQNIIIVNKNDQRLVEVATITFFLLIALWVFSLYLAHQLKPSNWTFAIGVITYIIGVVFTEIKEVV